MRRGLAVVGLSGTLVLGLASPASAHSRPYCGHHAHQHGSYSREVFVKHATLPDGRHRHRYIRERLMLFGLGDIWYPYAWTTRTC